MTQNHNMTYDVIIIGGGMAGLSLSLCLSQKGQNVACVDMADPALQKQVAFDGRTVAISAGSSEVMKMAGIWDLLLPVACPIREIDIRDGGTPSLLNFLVQEIGEESFGWIIENRHVREALFAAADQEDTLTHIAPAKVLSFQTTGEGVRVVLDTGDELDARLLVGADGRNSWVREQAEILTRGWTYNQRAIICTVQHEHPHGNIALEDFRAEGPFAVLPMLDDDQGFHRSSIVWTEHGRASSSAIHYDTGTFNLALNARFPDFYGEVKQITSAQSYPLGLVHAERYIAHRLALVADAAHGIHPIAGQGLNIGLRDVKALTELASSSADPGDSDLLHEYERQRRIDNMGMIFATDALNKLFSNDFPPLKAARRLGLRGIARLPFAKKYFMKQATGIS